MKRIVIEGKVRSEVGTPASRRARADGFVPANIYGHKQPNVHFMLPRDEITRMVQDEHHLLTIDIAGNKDSGLLKEVQFDTFGRRILHVDFVRVSLEDIIDTSIPVHVIGVARGVAAGSVLDVVLHNIAIRGKVSDLPEHFDLDVAALNIGDAIRVKDLKLPAGVVALAGPEEPVLVVHYQRKEEPAAAAAEAAAPAGAAPAAGATPTAAGS